MSSTIEKLELCDFRPIFEHLKLEREKRRNRSKAERDEEKQRKLEEKEKYGYAIVDGQKESIANYMVEPPGLFLGRGRHPKAGKVKKRIMPGDVTLNIGKNANIPPCSLDGHKWGKVSCIFNLSASFSYFFFLKNYFQRLFTMIKFHGSQVGPIQSTIAPNLCF